MGILGSLMFWKKKDIGFEREPPIKPFGEDSGLGASLGTNLGLPNDTLGLGRDPLEADSSQHSGSQFGNQMGQETFSFPKVGGSQNPYQQMQQQQPQRMPDNRDLELISVKLDSIRVSLDSINQRLANLEQIARSSNSGNNSRNW